MWCVCAQSYMVQSKKIFDHFICFWKWFLSLFVFMFNVYFVSNCLNMFCIEKTGVRVFRGSAGDSPVVKHQLRVHPEVFGYSLASFSRPTRDSRKFSRLNLTTRSLLATHSRLAKIFAAEPRDSPSRETPRKSFLKGFLWETCFKPLSSSFKPLFQYFYIKTQSNWMVFHSFNISKVIINYFY